MYTARCTRVLGIAFLQDSGGLERRWDAFLAFLVLRLLRLFFELLRALGAGNIMLVICLTGLRHRFFFFLGSAAGDNGGGGGSSCFFVKNNLVWGGSMRGLTRWDLDRPTGNRRKDHAQGCWRT